MAVQSIYLCAKRLASVFSPALNPNNRVNRVGRTKRMRRPATALILMAVRARGLLPGPLLTVRTRPSASRTHAAMASSQLTDRMEAIGRIPGRILAGFTASVTGWRAKHDGGSCDLLFDDEDHAATWYVCKQQPHEDTENVSCTMLDEPGFGDEPGIADPDARWICKSRKPGVDGWGEFEEVDPNFALRWLT